MNKTIYLPDEEADTWEKARRLAKDRLSPIILKVLKEFVAVREADAAGFERIQVEFEDSDDSEIPKIKAFRGKWIFSPSAPLRVPLDKVGTKSLIFCVAVTAKNNVVVYTWTSEVETKGENAGDQHTSDSRFLVYPSFEEAARDEGVNVAILEAIRKRGVPVEELDI
jgi:hypothetical protein